MAVATHGSGVTTDPKKLITPAAAGIVGASAGWVVRAGANTAFATSAASQTGGTFVIPVYGLAVGDVITGFNLVGQVESAGNNVTINAVLKKNTAAAADVAAADVGAITELVVAADTILSADNAGKTGLSETVGVDETFFLLITSTTTASTDIVLQSLIVNVN